MNPKESSLLRIIWKTPLFRRIMTVVIIAAFILPGYDLMIVYPSFERVMAKWIEKEASSTARHLLHSISDGEPTQNTFSKETFTPETVAHMHQATRNFGLWKIRVFSTKGEIVFSTKGSEIGTLNKKDYFFNIVAKGLAFTKIERKHETNMEGEVLPLDVVEVYAPIMQQGKFIGAFEIYYEVTEELARLQSLVTKSGWIFLALIFAILTSITLLLFRSAEESRRLLKTQRDLSTQEKIFRDIIDAAQDGVMVTDAEQRIKIINPAFSELTGYGEHDVLMKTPNVLRSGRHNEVFYQQMWQSIQEHKRWRGEIWNRRKDGSIFPELLSISTIEDDADDVTHYVGIFNDISHQKETEQRYQKMAYHDPLTNLPNRLMFRDRLELAIRESVRSGSRVALLFLDLDGFKQVNDNAGHDAGDIVLQEISKRLSSAVRQEDTVSRLGGDEFTLILKNIESKEVLEKLGNKLIKAINQPIKILDESFHVGASIGIVCYPVTAKDSERLISEADEAMYAAKAAGKNRIVMRCDTT